MAVTAERKISPLRRQRLSVGLSLEDFAAAVQVSLSTASEWETGKKKPEQPRHERLAEVLKVTIPELVSILYPSDEATPAK